MARTIRRQPFSVSTDSNDYAKSNIFTQAEFKGLCDNTNDAIIDAQTFAEVNNIYVNDGGLLVSRPPIKLYDNNAFIIEDWQFGVYGLRLHRILCHINDDNTYTQIDNPQEYPQEELGFIFLLRCTTHTTISSTNAKSEWAWIIPVSNIGWNVLPKVTCVQIEDKIFVWFANISFIAFNTTGLLMTDGNTYPYFEDAVKYLYFPVHKLVINGIETDSETKNFLTDTYRRRYLHSSISSVNFEKLVGRNLRVNLNTAATQNKSKYLYNITVQEQQDKTLIYPYSTVGNNHIDIAQTDRATVVLRYGIDTGNLEVSFDGKYFVSIPRPVEQIIGVPQLTRDGFWLVAFTPRGLARCRLVAQETDDFIEPERVFSWSIAAYADNAIINGDIHLFNEIDTSFIPKGYFETIDQFAYVFKAKSVYADITDNVPYLYTEWLSGANDLTWGFSNLLGVTDDGNIYHILSNDDVKVHFRYVAPTIDHSDLGAAVVLFSPSLSYSVGDVQESTSGMLFIQFKSNNVRRALQNSDRVMLKSAARNQFGYCTKLDTAGKTPTEGAETIGNGDTVIFPSIPLDASNSPDWRDDVEYYPGDRVCYADNGYLYRCNVTAKGIPPTDTSFWEPILRDDGSGHYYYLPKYYPLEITVMEGDLLLPKWYRIYLSWAYVILAGSNAAVRYKISEAESTIYPGDTIKLTPTREAITYSTDELESLFGKIYAVPLDGGSMSEFSWSFLYPSGVIISPNANAKETTCKILLPDLATVSIDRKRIFNLARPGETFRLPAHRTDIVISTPIIDVNDITYTFTLGYGTKTETNETIDCLNVFEYKYIDDEWSMNKNIRITGVNSQWFKIMPNTSNLLTENYLFFDDEVLHIPDNGELTPIDNDRDRVVANEDNLILALQYGAKDVRAYGAHIHKLSADCTSLISGQIKSNDVIAFAQDAIDAKDYLTPRTHSAGIGGASNAYYIQKLAVSDGRFIVVDGDIKVNELVRLHAYDKKITLPVGNPGNPYKVPLEVSPWTWPSAPDGWEIGDAWPSTWSISPPLIPQDGGTMRLWQPGDDLPIGPVELYGIVNIGKRIRPLSINDNGLWYNIDGTLWTSQKNDDVIMELDEFVNAETKNGVTYIDANLDIPNYSAVLNEYYFAYEKQGKHLLEVTATRRDEDKLFSDDGTDFLLYLPERNEQKLANKITGLHPLSDTEIGIFTENEVWYVRALTLNDGTLAYTKPIKSKIPIGCRDGDDIITALDGQAIIFPTARGITMMAPQDFVATAEKTLTYLSDAIQKKYNAFYKEGVKSAALLPREFEVAYSPSIRICTYRYWILFYKYLDREILALDTRAGTWWIWTAQYPIRLLRGGSRLQMILQIDFNPVDSIGIQYPAKRTPLMGMSFLWADDEITAGKINYADDVIAGALNGLSELVYENEYVGSRRLLKYASPIIDWRFTSQKLHFGQLHNYKAIKGLSVNVRGDEIFTAKLSTKAYRDFYHPEQNNTVEIKVNDLRTFVKRFNLMHVVDFQYTFENDAEIDTQYQLKLNSLSIKYEVKERIR